MMVFARAVVVLFLVASERRESAALEARVTLGGRTFRRAPAQSRSLLTWFGVVRYTRTYLREVVPAGACYQARWMMALRSRSTMAIAAWVA